MPGPVVVNLCQCIFPSLPFCLKQEQNDDDDEEVQPLIKEDVGKFKDAAAAAAIRSTKDLEANMLKQKANAKLDINIMMHCNRSLDIFKGVLVVFMTYAHVDLTLMNPAEQYLDRWPHFVGNMASGLCFLGFMLAYGFSCDNAYLSDWKDRTTVQRLTRVARSAMLPLIAAWICSFAWGFMSFKIPINLDIFSQILDFRLAIGNGPDFLLCFTCSLLVMYPLRHLINQELSSDSIWRRILCGVSMLLIPLLFTQFYIVDCLGNKKYFGYLFECTNREAYAPVLPTLPHLFYFNIGVLLSRHIKHTDKRMKAGQILDVDRTLTVFVVLTAVFAILSYPLMSVWSMSYGNLMVDTRFGMITRGWTNGPSLLWLLGNLFGVNVLLVTCAVLQVLQWRTQHVMALFPVRMLLSQLEHLGANVLLYLVVCDICLAGLWRGAIGQYPLQAAGCGAMTIGILLIVRFVLYLGASSRSG